MTGKKTFLKNYLTGKITKFDTLDSLSKHLNLAPTSVANHRNSSDGTIVKGYFSISKHKSFGVVKDPLELYGKRKQKAIYILINKSKNSQETLVFDNTLLISKLLKKEIKTVYNYLDRKTTHKKYILMRYSDYKSLKEDVDWRYIAQLLVITKMKLKGKKK